MASYTLKPGVSGVVAPQLAAGLDVAAAVYAEFNYPLVISSLAEPVPGVDRSKSLHPRGYAADLSTSMVGGQVSALLAALKSRLGPDFDVIYEAAGTDNSTAPHIHIEYDPDHDGGKRLPDVTAAPGAPAFDPSAGFPALISDVTPSPLDTFGDGGQPATSEASTVGSGLMIGGGIAIGSLILYWLFGRN